MLTLSIQSKGDSNHNASMPRGPGRPPISDVTVEDIAELEDPVNKTIFTSFFFAKCFII